MYPSRPTKPSSTSPIVHKLPSATKDDHRYYP
ncbi:hypothetical protein SNOG_16332 [Parastagonospora nodorum SN15]|uniref:Uncharacterized protein n=1 Tax=Phaeosphaeria nodorum (strain SN15 / ATCC MYA-4574 / FGSC 10173) TaxID=321614 RepID=Q0TW13_PHANO|nr:hypothetical protein SNOG_16332 [Parastagonospora nodorum SN15]EAT76318.1 hypothetical protein SNOG_16332 [Parastagonospora nodorum SN15]